MHPRRKAEQRSRGRVDAVDAFRIESSSSWSWSYLQRPNDVIECLGQSRPLLRGKESDGAVVENNQLTNVSDADRCKNDGRELAGAWNGTREGFCQNQ